jgi:hypothetical protein
MSGLCSRWVERDGDIVVPAGRHPASRLARRMCESSTMVVVI